MDTKNDLPAGTNELPAGKSELPAGTNELPAGTNELPVKKRRRMLWTRNTKNDSPNDVLTLEGFAPCDKSPPSSTSPPLPEEKAEEECKYAEEECKSAEEECKSSQNVAETRRLNEMKRFRISRTRKKETPPIQHFTVLNIPVPVNGVPAKRPKLSKIDLAILRRRTRFGTQEGENSEEEVDLCIRSGPPCRLDLEGGKGEFLERVGLVTHTSKNCIELQKLMRRKWLVPDTVEEPEPQRIQPLDLPVPSKSPSGTNSMLNHKHKRNFLHFLGLSNVPTIKKQEMEQAWKAVVAERLRRNCESPLTKYYQKSCVAEPNQKTNVSSMLPIVHQYKRHIFNNSETDKALHYLKIEDSSRKPDFLSLLRNPHYQKIFPQAAMENILRFPTPVVKTEETSMEIKLEEIKPKIPSCLPLRRILGNDRNQSFGDGDRGLSDPENSKENLRVVSRENKFKWPGLLEIREAYVRYSKEKSLEISELRKQRFILSDDNLKMQNLVKFLERKQRTLHSFLFKTDRENKNLQMTIDQLTNIINCFR